MSAAGDAAFAASLFAVDPAGLGGVCLRSLAQPARAQWLQMVRDLLPGDLPMRRIPFNIADGRLLGGLDLVATLRAGRPVAERGILAATDGGVVVVTMTERITAHTAAFLNAVLDSGEINVQREGIQMQVQTRVGIVALDESMEADERVPASLLDRLAFLIDLTGFDARTPLVQLHEAQEVAEARRLLPQVTVSADLIAALCGTALALGAGSARVSLLAVNAARAAAALDGRTEVNVEDANAAGTLVFAPRATQLPSPRERPSQSPSQDETNQDETPRDGGPQNEMPVNEAPRARDESAQNEAPPPPAAPAPSEQTDAAEQEAQPPLEIGQEEVDIVLAAAQAAIPSGLLDRLRSAAAARSAPAPAGGAGTARSGGTRGRPSGIRSGMPQGSARLNVIETLRAAAPWQRLRGRTQPGDHRVRIEASDFRITRYQQRTRTLTIFAVDASGSAALNRLAEAKGAVELLLAECYVRRDQVAVVAFRGRGAEILLAPTRSLVRAKRSLAGLPGGGGTPLAAGIQSATLVASQAQRRGETPTVVILTDGRANVARGGTGGREAAHADALQAARQLRLSKVAALFVDTSPRPNALAQSLAAAMDARYIPLPFANAQALSRIVTAATPRAAR